jgi:hypothetical protein
VNKEQIIKLLEEEIKYAKSIGVNPFLIFGIQQAISVIRLEKATKDESLGSF